MRIRPAGRPPATIPATDSPRRTRIRPLAAISTRHARPPTAGPPQVRYAAGNLSWGVIRGNAGATHRPTPQGRSAAFAAAVAFLQQTIEGIERLMADMMLDALGIDPRHVLADPQGAQEGVDDLVTPPAVLGEVATVAGEEDRTVGLRMHQAITLQTG